ncbi:MAG TPA: cytochrome c maturation protein CcmE [Acidimicrobiales bacterium]|nr:cytochrome c maturation protein CcmE [Acidimicrobiales bacterium]
MVEETTEQRRNDEGQRHFDRSRLRLGIVIAVICGALAFLVLQGLGNATTYFYNADEALARQRELGDDRFRLQGTVVPGSVRQSGDEVAFQVEYACATVGVVHQGAPPELFADGIPVVLEGGYAEGTDTFASDRILVRHTSEYRTEEADRLALAAEQGCPT